MLVLLSPAKSMNFDPMPIIGEAQEPLLINKSQELIDILQDLSVIQIEKLMNISQNLAQLNHTRFQNFTTPFTAENAKQAILAFNGNVYDGLNVRDFSGQDFQSCQARICILSGLYGLIRPLDLIQPYRLEMGTKLPNPSGKNLYNFWGEQITQQINNISGSKVIVNLASNEYFKSVKTKQLKGQLITVNFKEKKDGQYKIIGIFAKRARGMMARYIVKNQIDNINDLAGFDESGYIFNPELSTEHELIFTR